MAAPTPRRREASKEELEDGQAHLRELSSAIAEFTEGKWQTHPPRQLQSQVRSMKALSDAARKFTKAFGEPLPEELNTLPGLCTSADDIINFTKNCWPKWKEMGAHACQEYINRLKSGVPDYVSKAMVRKKLNDANWAPT